jgi:hypothetical protein
MKEITSIRPVLLISARIWGKLCAVIDRSYENAVRITASRYGLICHRQTSSREAMAEFLGISLVSGPPPEYT